MVEEESLDKSFLLASFALFNQNLNDLIQRPLFLSAPRNNVMDEGALY